MRTRTVCRAVAIAMVAIVTACSQADPQIRVSADRIPRHGTLDVHGTGFTPARSVSSHLRRSDGSEFPVLPILTDQQGAFTHTIDTMILELGTHELWVVDDASGRTSNRVEFEVTIEYRPS